MSIEKDLAKYTALRLIAMQLHHQCDARDTLHQFDYEDEFLAVVNKEIEKAVKSLDNRANKLNLKYRGLLPNYVSESQEYYFK